MKWDDFLLALYPKAWREQYEEEYRALLQEMDKTPKIIGDVMKNALKMQSELIKRLIAILASMVWYNIVLSYALTHDLTANMIWAPTNPGRTIVLLAGLAPIIASFCWFVVFRARLQK